MFSDVPATVMNSFFIEANSLIGSDNLVIHSPVKEWQP